jgi:hypothetical protein
MKDNEINATFPMLPSTGLCGTQFTTLKNARINNPEKPEKYNYNEMKYGVFYGCHTAFDICCCEV